MITPSASSARSFAIDAAAMSASSLASCACARVRSSSVPTPAFRRSRVVDLDLRRVARVLRDVHQARRRVRREVRARSRSRHRASSHPADAAVTATFSFARSRSATACMSTSGAARFACAITAVRREGAPAHQLEAIALEPQVARAKPELRQQRRGRLRQQALDARDLVERDQAVRVVRDGASHGLAKRQPLGWLREPPHARAARLASHHLTSSPSADLVRRRHHRLHPRTAIADLVADARRQHVAGLRRP